MDTLVTEKNGRLFLTSSARVIHQGTEVGEDYASVAWSVEQSNPFVKWIAGSYVESDKPNTNTQFWTAQDLAFGEYSIRYAPLNMLHKVDKPMGFFQATERVFLSDDDAASGGKSGPFRIEALAGMWSHLFPVESSLVDQASDKNLLFFSMECRGEKLHCAGQAGCGETFDYMDASSHCEHLKERSSVRHIVNPTFRGGALVIPPVRPGWKDARAHVMEEAVKDEARKYAESTERQFEQAKASGSDLTPGDWEALMATILQLA